MGWATFSILERCSRVTWLPSHLAFIFYGGMHRWAGHIYPDSAATLELCALVNGVGSQLTQALLLSVGKERKLFCFMIHSKSHRNDGLKIIPLLPCVKTFTAHRRGTSSGAICSPTVTWMKHEGNMTIRSLWQCGGWRVEEISPN